MWELLSLLSLLLLNVKHKFCPFHCVGLMLPCSGGVDVAGYEWYAGAWMRRWSSWLWADYRAAQWTSWLRCHHRHLRRLHGLAAKTSEQRRWQCRQCQSTFRSRLTVCSDSGPMWAREHCRISPPRFLAECRKRRLNQASIVVLCFVFFTFSGLCLVCVMSVFDLSSVHIFQRTLTWMALYLCWCAVKKLLTHSLFRQCK